MVTASKEDRVASDPDVLCLHLKRFTPDTLSKNNRHVCCGFHPYLEHPYDSVCLCPILIVCLPNSSPSDNIRHVPFLETLDLHPFMESNVAQKGEYRLHAVLVHTGSLDFGHYTAYGMSLVSNFDV